MSNVIPKSAIGEGWINITDNTFNFKDLTGNVLSWPMCNHRLYPTQIDPMTKGYACIDCGKTFEAYEPAEKDVVGWGGHLTEIAEEEPESERVRNLTGLR